MHTLIVEDDLTHPWLSDDYMDVKNKLKDILDEEASIFLLKE
ncbi:MAG: hypothetical protein ACTSVI_15120 [Promethearchaeota archaeon]